MWSTQHCWKMRHNGKKKPRYILRGFLFYGGADGARTRDPRRDRPVF